MPSVGFPTLFIARDTNGDPVSGAKCYFYETGTATPLTVYSDTGLSSAVSAPQIADSSGIFAPFYTDGSTQIKIDVFDADDVRLPGYPLDPIDLEDTGGGGSGAGSVTFTPTARIAATDVQAAIEEVDGTHLKAVEDARTLERLLITTAGSSNAYTASASGYTAYASGDRFWLKFDRDNTGAATLNIESVGAKDLQKYDEGGSNVALVASDIVAGDTKLVHYDGTQFMILNPTNPIGVLQTVKGADVASAADLSPAADGNSFDVTGTTTITSIDVTNGFFPVGSHITLQFDGALTLTHHATDLVLPGGANITTAAGDIAVLYKYAAGDWRCVSYQIAATAPGGGNGWSFIATADLSAAASSDWTGFDSSSYDAYCFVLQNVIPATDAVVLRFRTSTDGGSTYDSSASNYAWAFYGALLDPEGISSVGDTEIELTANVGSAAGEDGVSGVLYVNGPHLAKKTTVTWNLFYEDSGGVHIPSVGGGTRLSSADVDAVQFLFSSGNIESGTITMYGMANA